MKLRKIRSQSASATTLLLSVILVSGGIITSNESAAASFRKPATTSQSATHKKPSPSRSRYSSRLTPRKAGENLSKQTTRSSADRSAFGDGRRNGIRLNNSPVTAQTTGQTSRDTRRDAVQLSGTPATSWRSWNRATQPSARTQSGTQQVRQSKSGMRVTFKSDLPTRR